MARRSTPATSPTVLVFVRDMMGDVFHYSANAPEAVEEAVRGAREWLRYVRRPGYTGRRPCGNATVVVEPAA